MISMHELRKYSDTTKKMLDEAVSSYQKNGYNKEDLEVMRTAIDNCKDMVCMEKDLMEMRQLNPTSEADNHFSQYKEDKKLYMKERKPEQKIAVMEDLAHMLDGINNSFNEMKEMEFVDGEKEMIKAKLKSMSDMF